MQQDRERLKQKALNDLSMYLDSVDEKHSNLLSYWISDYVRFLNRESTFDPKKLVRYKRGSIVKAHLGYRIGNEEGGLHYAVVLENSNAMKSGVVTIVPLTSVKNDVELEKLHFSNVYLGDEIYKNLQEKLHAETADLDNFKKELLDKLADLHIRSLELMHSDKPHDDLMRESDKITAEISKLRERISLVEGKKKSLANIQKEISKMKRGSIALVGQITTISKIRIYSPLHPSDALTNIRLSVDAMDKIDDKTKELFTYQKKSGM